MTAADPGRRSERPSQPMTGLLVLVVSLFAALICLAFGVLWLLDESRTPGRWLIVMPLVAVAALAASAFADTTWSVRRTRTTELGNTTRLVAIGAVLVAIPSILITMAGSDDRPGSSRGIERACPDDEVPDAVFVDVLPDSTHSGAVNCLVWWDIVSDDADTFSPTSTVTRAQMATIVDRLASAAGAELGDDDPATFADIDGDAHAEAIGRVAAAGIMGGQDDTTFNPGGVLTRDQMATLVARVYEHVAGEPLPPGEGDAVDFDDIDTSVHADNIRAVATAGIVTGDSGSYNPGTAVTRAQMATMLARTLDLLVADGAADLPT